MRGARQANKALGEGMHLWNSSRFPGRAGILRLTHFFTILSLLLALVGTAPAEALAANIPTGIQQAGQAELNAPVSHAQDGPLASPADVAALSPGVTDTLTATITITPTLPSTSGEASLIQPTPEQGISSVEIAGKMGRYLCLASPSETDEPAPEPT